MLPIFDSSLRVPSEWTDLVRDLIAASGLWRNCSSVQFCFQICVFLERAQLQPAAPTPSSSLKVRLTFKYYLTISF